jgi:hypothetical protein
MKIPVPPWNPTPRAGLSEQLRPLWVELAPQFDRKIGLAGLEAACLSMWIIRDAAERIQREQIVVEGSRGEIGPHPAMVPLRQAQADLARWLKDFPAKL